MNEKVPLFIREAFVKSKPETNDEYFAEITLWRECVARLISDVLSKTGVSKHGLHNSIIRSARLYLKFNREGVLYILENAGLNLNVDRFRRELLLINPEWKED